MNALLNFLFGWFGKLWLFITNISAIKGIEDFVVTVVAIIALLAVGAFITSKLSRIRESSILGGSCISCKYYGVGYCTHSSHINEDNDIGVDTICGYYEKRG